MGKLGPIILVLLFFFFGCNYQHLKSGTVPLVAEPNFAWIQTNILGPKCMGCHNSANASVGVDLSSYERLMASEVKGISIVAYKDATNSKLYTSVQSGAMPKGSHRLSDVEANAIRDWIDSGAKND